MDSSVSASDFSAWLAAVKDFARSSFSDHALRRAAIRTLPAVPGAPLPFSQKDLKLRDYASLSSKRMALDRFLAVVRETPNDLDSRMGAAAACAAAACGDLDSLKWLIENGVPADAAEKHGRTPLTSAIVDCRNDASAIVAYLIGLGVDVKVDQSEEPPLGLALGNGRYDLAKLLIEAGADPDRYGFSLLHQAAAWGTGGERASRIALTASLEKTDLMARTPWLVAVHAGNVEAAQHLARAGASTRVQTDHATTALHLAAQADRAEMLQELLNHQSDPDPRDHGGSTPLHVASAHGSTAAAGVLLKAGANLDAGNETWDRPVNDAGSIAILDLLDRCGADLNHVSGLFWPLKTFSQSGDLEAVHFLLSRGAKVDQDYHGETALHSAIGSDYLEIAAVFLELGANPDITDMDGDPPLAWARSPQAEMLLRCYGVKNR